MKKYIKPAMEIYETEVQEMICISGGGSRPNVNAEAPMNLFDEEEILDFQNNEYKF